MFSCFDSKADDDLKIYEIGEDDDITDWSFLERKPEPVYNFMDDDKEFWSQIQDSDAKPDGLTEYLKTLV